MAGLDYWCYQCNRTVRPHGGGSSLVCPNCEGGFLEEAVAPELPEEDELFPWNLMRGRDFDGGWMRGVASSQENPWQQGTSMRPRPPRTPPMNNPANNLTPSLEAISSLFQQMQDAQTGAGGVGGGGSGQEIVPGGERLARFSEGFTRYGMDPGPMSRMLMLQGHLQRLLAGGNVEIFFDNGAGPRRLPGNMGDYFFGPGLDQLLQQLAENDPYRRGPPPAAKSAVDALPTISITQEHLGTDAAQCAVCKDEFEMGAAVRQMPCKHMYHPDCILPWLATHNSCPVCRYELPTDDPEYDRARTQPSVPPQEVNQRPLAAPPPPPPPPFASEAEQTSGRRFSITLPWPFRMPAASSQSPANAQAESSSQSTSTETVSSRPRASEFSDNNNAGQSSRARRYRDEGNNSMPEPRQEGLIRRSPQEVHEILSLCAIFML